MVKVYGIHKYFPLLNLSHMLLGKVRAWVPFVLKVNVWNRVGTAFVRASYGEDFKT